LAPPAQPGQQAPPAWVNMVPLALLVAVFYFALIRPQQKKAK
jgi:preprotein translocase subunit YajC